MKSRNAKFLELNNSYRISTNKTIKPHDQIVEKQT